MCMLWLLLVLLAQPAAPSRGAAMCATPKMVRPVLVQLQRLRPWLGQGDAHMAGVEVFHVGELGPSDVAAIEAASNVTRVVDLSPKILERYAGRSGGEDLLQKFRGFRCKPMALVHSRFDEVNQHAAAIRVFGPIAAAVRLP